MSALLKLQVVRCYSISVGLDVQMLVMTFRAQLIEREPGVLRCGVSCCRSASYFHVVVIVLHRVISGAIRVPRPDIFEYADACPASAQGTVLDTTR